MPPRGDSVAAFPRGSFLFDERFQFEEMPDSPVHEQYLWGNGAICCACLLGQSFAESGWNFHPGQYSELTGIPMHIYQEDGESVAHPCGELLLTERGVQRLLSKGLMPLLSVAGQDAVRLGSFDSITGSPLTGRWS